MTEIRSDSTVTFGRSLLVVAHPGHEIRIHGWMEREKPTVMVITDGSGSTGTSRLESTLQILKQTGAIPGPSFGCYTDRELYAALMTQDPAPFLTLVSDVVSCIHQNAVETVVADVSDAYNPMHDICRLIVNCAVAQIRLLGKSLNNYAFTLVGPPQIPENAPTAAILCLNDEEFRRKQDAARSYVPLRKDIASVLHNCPWEEFRREYFYPDEDLSPSPARPYYEVYGEAQVASGHYKSVLRYEQHVRPLAEVLQKLLVACES